MDTDIEEQFWVYKCAGFTVDEMFWMNITLIIFVIYDQFWSIQYIVSCHHFS